MHLTDTLCKKIQRPAKGNKISYDDEVAGLGLRTTVGGAKAFVLNFRRRSDGRERRLTIGQFPAWSVAQARAEAKRLRVAVDLGGDPLDEAKKLRGEPTLAEVAERDMHEYLQPRLRPSTVANYRRQLSADILAALGKAKIGSNSDQDIADLHKTICARGSTIAANRVVTTLSGILTRAIDRGERTEPNPVHQFVQAKETDQRAPPRPLFCHATRPRACSPRSMPSVIVKPLTLCASC